MSHLLRSTISFTQELFKRRFIELILFGYLSYYLYSITNKILYATTNCDIGWLIYAAKAASGGKVLYKDLFEINPPLIFSVHFLSNYIADFIGADYMLTFNALILICMVLIFALTLKVIQSLLSSNFQKFLLISGLFIYLIILPLSRAVYGEREHLFVMLVTPYILSIYLEIKSKKKAGFGWLVYALALFGFILKPFYLIFFFAAEVSLLLSKRKAFNDRKVIYLVLLVMVALYLAGVYIFTPYYFSDVLPIGLKTYYGHRFSNKELVHGLLNNIVPLPFIFLLIAFSDKLLAVGTRRLWLSMLIASLILPLIQFKGWPYTYFPLLAFCFLSLLMVISESNLNLEFFRVTKKIIKNIFNGISLSSVLTYAFLCMATTAVMSKLFMELNPVSLYLEPFSLYFIIFIGVVLKNHKTFNYRGNILIATISLLFLMLYCLREVVFTLTFIASPLLITLTVCIFVFGLLSARNLKFNKDHKLYVLPIVIVALVAFYVRFTAINNYEMRNRPRNDVVFSTLQDIIESEAPNQNIFVFNTNLYPAFPLVNYTNVGWGSRFHHLWMLPAIYENATAENKCLVEEKFIPARDFVYKAIYEDLKSSSPKLVIFDLSPQVFLWKESPYFDWHECIQKANPQLGEFINNNYHLINKFNFCKGNRRSSCAYEIYEKSNLLTNADTRIR